MSLPFLLRPGYWFSVQALPFLSWSGYVVLLLMVALLLASLALWFIAREGKFDKEDRRIYRRFSHVCLWAGIVGLILYALTWLRVPVLSMRIFFVVWFLGFGYWAWTIARYKLRELPILRTKAAERAAYEKWLPKPKR